MEDLRLVGPALTVWGVTWAMSGGLWLPVVALGVVLTVLGGWRWVLVSAGAAVLCAGLTAVEAGRGPVAELARRGGEASFEVVLGGDPAPRAGGVAVPGEAERVGGVRVRTPVTVYGRGSAARAWAGLLPSTRVAVTARAVVGRDGGVILLARGSPRVLADATAVQRAAGRLRSGLRQASERLPPDARGLLPGLVIGDTGGVPDDLSTAFEDTDLTHIVSVSGANLAIVLVALVGPLGRARTRERGGIAAWCGLSLRATALAGGALAVGFVVLCRPDPSVLRAAATGVIGLLALAVGRRAHALPALAGAVLLLLLLDPPLARSYGFALSVFATAGLIVLGTRWTEALATRGWPHRLAESVACAAAAQAFCAPLLVVRAARVSLIAIPCNLLAEIAVGPATLLGFLVLALAPLSLGAARLVAQIAAVPTTWIADVARYGAAVPNTQLRWPGGPWGAIALLVVLTALVLAAPVLRRPLPLLALVLLLLVVLLRPVPVVRVLTGWPPGHWDLVACDVGQGDALVVHTGPATALVVDAGPDPRLVDTCLSALGVTRVPLLLLTHDHADHVEGVPGVLRGRAVGAIETTTLDEPAAEAHRVRTWAAAAGVPVLRVAPGEVRRLGDATWRVVWPDEARPADPNNASVSLLLTVHGLRIALLGDVEPLAQQRIPLGRVDVLKVPHHGSSHQDEDLLGRLRPRLALISCGKDNRYGHPSPATIARLRGLGATVLRTDTQGALAVVGDAAHLGAVTEHPNNTSPSPAGPASPGPDGAAAPAPAGSGPASPRPARPGGSPPGAGWSGG